MVFNPHRSRAVRFFGPAGEHSARLLGRLLSSSAQDHRVAVRRLAVAGLVLLVGRSAGWIGPPSIAASAASSNVSLAGVHWYRGDSAMLDTSLPLGERGWNVEVIFDVGWCDGDRGSDPGGVRAVAQTAKDHGLVNIIRVDYRDRVAVPPNSGDYAAWASSFIKCTSELSDLSSLYIVGNEPNIEGNVGAAQYAAAFNYLYARRGEMPAGTQLLATFNSPFTPPVWMNEMANALSGVDGFALHTGGIRGNCQDPRQSCSYGGWSFDGAFRYYRDVINNIPSTWWSRPVYITEFNTFTGDPGSEPQNNYLADWINKAFEEVRNYNATRGSKPQVEALAWFVDRPQSWPQFSLRNITAARTDMGEEFRNLANRIGGPAPTSTPSSPTPSAAGPLQNGGFEGAVQPNGVGASWTAFSSSGYGSSFAVVSDVVHAGTRAQRVHSQPTTNDQYAGVFQTIGTTPGVSYTVRAWNRVSLPGGSGWPLVGRLGIDLTGGINYAAASVAWVEFDAPENGAGNWVFRERSVTATGTRMTIFLQSWRKWSAGSISDTWFDDVEILPQGGTPPTATLPPATPTQPPPTLPPATSTQPSPGLPPGQNVALGKPWQASSVYTANYSGDKATDGLVSAASKWTSSGASSESWLALDLGLSYNLTGFVVRHAGAAGEAAYFNTQAFRLESGPSFSGPWTTLASVNSPGQTQNVSSVLLTATARFVRLTITDAGIDNYARIPELEVYASGSLSPSPTPTPASPRPTSTAPPPTATMPPGCPPTLDFAAIRAQLNQQGQDLAFVKIGFHLTGTGRRDGLGTWEKCLDAAGVPFFLKSADDAGAILEALGYRLLSGVPHVLVFRRSGQNFDVPPEYFASPRPLAKTVAEIHWQRHRAELLRMFPEQLVLRSGVSVPRATYLRYVWIETINEVNKVDAEWYGAFATRTAELATADGFNWAAFGWSTGEPEGIHWQGPNMRGFLELAAANPDRIAIALHEYSLCGESLSNLGLGGEEPCLSPPHPGFYPDLLGRFESLYGITDGWGLRRPTILITEFGWEPTYVPSVEVAFDRDGEPAIDNLPWAAELYAQYPELKGASLWMLGQGYGGIADLVQRLIVPLTEYALQHYFVIPSQ